MRCESWLFPMVLMPVVVSGLSLRISEVRNSRPKSSPRIRGSPSALLVQVLGMSEMRAGNDAYCAHDILL